MVPALDLFWCASRWALLWFCSRCGLRLAATILRAEAPVAHCLCWPFAGFFHCVSQAGSQLKNAHMAYTHNTHVAPCWTGCVFLQVVGCFGYTRLIYGIFSSIYNGAQQANVMSLVFRVARSTHTQRYQYFLCVHGRSNMTFAGCINLLTDDYFTYHLQSSLIKGLPPALHGLASSFST